MVITYDKNGRVISRCRNLRYILERARRVPVDRVALTPTVQDDEWPGAIVQIAWSDGAHMETEFASFEVAKDLFERKARCRPRHPLRRPWPEPVFNY
jgi:hypothetical protein